MCCLSGRRLLSHQALFVSSRSFGEREREDKGDAPEAQTESTPHGLPPSMPSDGGASHVMAVSSHESDSHCCSGFGIGDEGSPFAQAL